MELLTAGTTPRIRRLEADVVNKIAAGEVIERPASVVKELLENSLDALATRVELEVARGGTDLIRVTDDGEGIEPDDLPLAIASHATSKLQEADDLFRVRTMGFRGEALASIASVSRFRLRSRTADHEVGSELKVDGHGHGHGDGLGDPQPVGCPVGTQVEVANLFHNTPVRRKFLKTVSTEFGHVAEQFTRLALAHPRLAAVLKHDGRTVFDLPATDSLIDRLELFYGSATTERLIPVESEVGEVKLWGFVGHPELSKGSRKGQYLFLNGRYIQDRSLQHALGEAYRGLVMVGRHPIAYLFLEMPPEMVDVNVHPTKNEVRFEDSSSLYRQLLSTLRTRFLSLDLSGTMRAPAGKRGEEQSTQPLEEQQHDRQLELKEWASSALESWKPVVEEASETGDGERASVREGEGAPETDSLSNADSPTPAPTDAPPPNQPDARVMQILDTYIVSETDSGLAVFDQHALHERVMYESLRRRVLEGAVETQKLLVPESLELSPKEAHIAIEHLELFGKLGYSVEDFGGNTVLLSGYPALLAKADYVTLFRDLLERIGETDGDPTRRDSIDSLLHMMSCKAAIKAGQRLSDDEMHSLLAQRHLVENSHHCPHGRPTALLLSREELDRQFGRLG
ncbi:DNA mismatch repair endonuclease MutL [Stratiformator vulcanicus]|uniref:DNA mismatch repair protein MutL n=1 Tax=Stratiformator vulcanicus TaxID=2527980 RepID=A0A517R2K2_9PLAN|nr:DNA mismatch repair endonuclease MutL [Stratiformator vulcanicus]QDT38109.1 DNA mismatch repair protein MutL [Stratiformator vulcanicus]